MPNLSGFLEVEQPYLDDGIYVLTGSNHTYYIDLRNILVISELYFDDNKWKINITFKFLERSQQYCLGSAYRTKASYGFVDPVPDNYIKQHFSKLMEAWVACRRKYAK